MFGRKKKTYNDDFDEVEALPRLSDEDAEIWSQPGPRNYEDVDTSEGYVDMGAILLPSRPGMQLRTQVADDGTTVLQILVVLGNSGIQMSVAAAPRSGGVWDELRDEIRAGFEKQGARVADIRTRYGAELLVDMPMKMPDGRSATSRMRILGREGDRWFAPPPPTLSLDSRSKKSSTASSFVATSSHVHAWSCCPFTCPQAPRRADMASWISRVGAALGLDKDARSLDAALDEDSARAARGVTPIRDVTDRSHALVFGTLLGMTYPPEEGAQRVLVATLYDGTDTLELRWPGRSSIPGLSVGQRLEVEGTVGRVGERTVIINPLYRVIAREG